jgi:hypothetical protein
MQRTLLLLMGVGWRDVTHRWASRRDGTGVGRRLLVEILFGERQ